MGLPGGQIVGGNPTRGRVARDFYTTNPQSVEAFITAHKPLLAGKTILEPCVCTGNIAEVLKAHGANVTGVDIEDYGYPGTVVADFLQWPPEELFDGIITNPPFCLAEEFVRHSLKCIKDGGEAAFFIKIQFLEGQKRQKFFKKFPPKYIYVFSSRTPTWREDCKVDPATNKPWATTMCNCWFVWQKGFKGEPIIRWIA